MIKDILLKKSKGEPEEDQKKYRKFVLCKINDNDFLIDILSVKEISNITEITPIPGVTSNVLGILNLRGLVVPIILIDFGDKPVNPISTELSRYVICEIEKEFIGIYVEEAQFIIDVDEEYIDKAKNIATGDSLFIKIVEVDNKKYGILNLKKLFDEYKIKNQE